MIVECTENGDLDAVKARLSEGHALKGDEFSDDSNLSESMEEDFQSPRRSGGQSQVRQGCRVPPAHQY